MNLIIYKTHKYTVFTYVHAHGLSSSKTSYNVGEIIFVLGTRITNIVGGSSTI